MSEAWKKSPTRDTIESLVVTVILAIFGTTFVLQAFKIPTGSMETTLLIGDHLLVNKFVFARPGGPLARVLPYREIRRGDVVVFKFPPSDEPTQQAGEHFVKRVIAVPGDRVRILRRQVWVNGQPVEEPFARYIYPQGSRLDDDFPPPAHYLRGATRRWSEELPNHLWNGELVVPPGRYFVMGDNRQQSWDSRFWGFVPRELISGKPLLIYWSFETSREEYTRTSLAERVSQTVDLVVHFFSKTRWRRTFGLVR